jgi:hypothetical protein
VATASVFQQARTVQVKSVHCAAPAMCDSVVYCLDVHGARVRVHGYRQRRYAAVLRIHCLSTSIPDQEESDLIEPILIMSLIRSVLSFAEQAAHKRLSGTSSLLLDPVMQATCMRRPLLPEAV